MDVRRLGLNRFEKPGLATRIAGLALILILAVGSGGVMLHGQENDRDDIQLERQVNSFFESLQEDETNAAYDQLLAGTQIAGRIELVRDLKKKTDELETRYGRYRGFERLQTRRLGNEVVVLQYLLKFENYLVLWHFTYYRVGASTDPLGVRDDWKLIALKFDTEFEQFAK